MANLNLYILAWGWQSAESHGIRLCNPACDGGSFLLVWQKKSDWYERDP
jgi:hypothetical protein